MSADYNTLTAKQKKVYAAIETYIKTTGIPPTVREIGEMVGEKTPGAVQGILNRLEMKGVIKRQMGMARSIKLVEQDTQYTKHVYVPLVKKITRRNADDILNIYNIEYYFPLPSLLLKDAEGLFIIKSPDKSVADNKKVNDEYLIVRLTDAIRDGDIVLVMYENLVLVREYHNENGTIHIKAEGSIITKERFDPTELTIIGRLEGRIGIYD